MEARGARRIDLRGGDACGGRKRYGGRREAQKLTVSKTLDSRPNELFRVNRTCRPRNQGHVAPI
jgi:hypothetical protein